MHDHDNVCMCIYDPMFLTNAACACLGIPRKLKIIKNFFSPHFEFILIFCKKDPLELEVTRQLLYLRNCV